MIAVELRHPGAHLGSERLGQGNRERFDQGHREAAGSTGGRHLGADEAGPDHGHAGAPVELGAEPQTVVEAAEHVDAGATLEARDRARARTRRDDEAVVVEFPAVIEAQTPLAGRQGERAVAELPFGVGRLVVRLRISWMCSASHLPASTSFESGGRS